MPVSGSGALTYDWQDLRREGSLLTSIPRVYVHVRESRAVLGKWMDGMESYLASNLHILSMKFTYMRLDIFDSILPL